MRTLVLASGSAARAELASEAGLVVVVDPPEVDERAHDELLLERGPEALALHLARAKAVDVARRHPGALVLGADQVGVLEVDGRPELLHQRPTHAGAVAQLMAMSGRTHRLVNGLVLLDTAVGTSHEGVDEHLVTMHPYDRAAADAYVRAFEPFECAGSYRIEDQARLAPAERLLASVAGEDPSGVRGLPLPLLDRLLSRCGPEAPRVSPPPPRR